MIRIFKQEVQRLFPILEAIKEGKTIQFHFPDGWRDIDGDDEGFTLKRLLKNLILLIQIDMYGLTKKQLMELYDEIYKIKEEE